MSENTRKSSVATIAKDERALFDALSMLENGQEAARFLRDLATPGELAAFAERWRIARLLDEGGHSYREIAAATGASTTTIGRVARFLRDEKHQGYRLVLDRLAPVSGEQT
jgi:TrpR-related protein YerC/YecD